MSRLLSIVSTYSALFVNVFAVDRPKCTPRRRLLLDAENNSSTPILSMKSFSRSGSSESGNTSSQFEINAAKSCCNLDWVIFYVKSVPFYLVFFYVLNIFTGYCPSPEEHGLLDSPSADFIRSVKVVVLV